MVGVIVEDMARAIEFYRRLGVTISEGSEQQQHVEIKMSGMTFFLTTKRFNAKWDSSRTDRTGGYGIILEFYLETQATVEAKYAEMIDYGYQSHVALCATMGETTSLKRLEEKCRAENKDIKRWFTR